MLEIASLSKRFGGLVAVDNLTSSVDAGLYPPRFGRYDI